jgi:outer membrane protein W
VRSARWFIVLAVVLAIGGATWAQSDAKYVARGHVFYSNPTGETSIGRITVEPDTAFGFDLGLEVLHGEKMGFNFTIGFSDHDIDPGGGKVEPTPVTGIVLFHITPDSSYDVYLGPGLAFVFYDDIFGFDVDNDLAIALQAGVDIPLATEGLSLSFDIRYIGTTADVEGFDFDIDPIIFGAGVAYRF